MKPRAKPQDSRMKDLLRSKLKNIINLRHELVRQSKLIDWARLEESFGPYYGEAGRPGLPIRLIVGLGRVELPTYGLGNRRSIQLSYSPNPQSLPCGRYRLVASRICQICTADV